MAEILLKIGKGGQTKTLVFSRNTRSPHENSANIVSTASEYGHKTRGCFEYDRAHQSLFLFVIYYFIYVFILLFSTAKLTLSTPQGKAQFVAWSTENRHSVNFERNTDGHQQQAA
jgi:hypothetical protein